MSMRHHESYRAPLLDMRTYFAHTHEDDDAGSLSERSLEDVEFSSSSLTDSGLTLLSNACLDEETHMTGNTHIYDKFSIDDIAVGDSLELIPLDNSSSDAAPVRDGRGKADGMPYELSMVDGGTSRRLQSVFKNPKQLFARGGGSVTRSGDVAPTDEQTGRLHGVSGMRRKYGRDAGRLAPGFSREGMESGSYNGEAMTVSTENSILNTLKANPIVPTTDFGVQGVSRVSSSLREGGDGVAAARYSDSSKYGGSNAILSNSDSDLVRALNWRSSPPPLSSTSRKNEGARRWLPTSSLPPLGAYSAAAKGSVGGNDRSMQRDSYVLSAFPSGVQDAIEANISCVELKNNLIEVCFANREKLLMLMILHTLYIVFLFVFFAIYQFFDLFGLIYITSTAILSISAFTGALKGYRCMLRLACVAVCIAIICSISIAVITCFKIYFPEPPNMLKPAGFHQQHAAVKQLHQTTPMRGAAFLPEPPAELSDGTSALHPAVDAAAGQAALPAGSWNNNSETHLSPRLHSAMHDANSSMISIPAIIVCLMPVAMVLLLHLPILVLCSRMSKLLGSVAKLDAYLEANLVLPSASLGSASGRLDALEPLLEGEQVPASGPELQHSSLGGPTRAKNIEMSLMGKSGDKSPDSGEGHNSFIATHFRRGDTSPYHFSIRSDDSSAAPEDGQTGWVVKSFFSSHYYKSFADSQLAKPGRSRSKPRKPYKSTLTSSRNLPRSNKTDATILPLSLEDDENNYYTFAQELL